MKSLGFKRQSRSYAYVNLDDDLAWCFYIG